MRSRFIQELFEINQSGFVLVLGFAYNLAQMLISDVIGVVYRIIDHDHKEKREDLHQSEGG